MTMHIDEIALYIVSMPLKEPFETSFGVEDDRQCVLIRIEAEGKTGWGECVASNYPGYSSETTGTAWHVLERFFIPAILGNEIESVDHYRSLVERYKGHHLARAGLEMALWDLQGHIQGRSLREMFHGTKRKVEVGVSVGLKPDIDSLLDTVGEYLQQGYGRIKLKIKPGIDVDIVSAVRHPYPDLALQVDANSAYTLEDSHVFTRMEEFDLILIEQPLGEDDIIDHSRLQPMLRTPLCLDESILHLRHARQAIEMEACKIINIKPGRVGGLSEAMAIHDYCRSVHVPVWCGGMLETNIGRASNLALASLPGFILPGDISASERYYQQDVADPDFVLNEDSTIDVPDGPGLGISIREESLREFTLKHEVFHR